MRCAHFIWSAILLCATLNGVGQESIGLGLSNYLPYNAVKLNPALAADSKTRIDIHLGGATFFGTNEHTYFAAEGPGLPAILLGNATDPVQDTDTHPRSGFIDASVEGPGVFAVLGRSAVGLSSRYRAMFNGQGVSHELAQFIYHGFRHSPMYDSVLFINDLDASMLTWGEVGFTFAHMLKVEGNQHINAGVTIKRLFGQDHLGLDIERMQFEFTSEDLLIDDFTGGYSLGTDNIGIGNGWAVDAGVLYRKTVQGNSDYVPYSEESRCYKTQYKYELGVSVIDMGMVDFRQNSAQVSLQNASAIWLNYIDTDVNDLDELDTFLEETFENDQNDAERSLGAKVALPTAINVQFDYHVRDAFYLGGVLQHPIKSKRDHALRRAAIIGVVPRYETKRFEASVPMSMYEMDRFQIGLALRYLGLTLGSDDLLAVITDDDLYGADVYAGLHILLVDRKSCSSGNRGKRRLIAPCWGQ